MRVKLIKGTKKYQGNYLAEGYVDENGDFIEHKPITFYDFISLYTFTIIFIDKSSSRLHLM